MDSNSGGNNNQGGEKKPQLTWTQPAIPQAQSQKNTPVSTPADTKKHLYKTTTFRNAAISLLLIAAVGVVAATIVAKKDKNSEGAALTAPSKTATSTDGTNIVPSSQTPSGDLAIASPQQAGLHVVVSKVSVTVPTWVVVYENHNGQPGNVLGAGLFMSGTNSGTIDLLRGTLPEQTYFVGKARDDGDRKYSLQNDLVLRDANGDPVLVQFKTN